MFKETQSRVKLKAFTLMEMMIVLVLSFFIVGILYLSYNLIEKQLRNEHQGQYSSLGLTKSSLDLDFFYADSIVSADDQILFFRRGEKSGYLFEDKAIIKTTGLLADTLFKGDCNVEFEMMQRQQWITSLILTAKLDTDEVRIAFRKKYLPNLKLKHKEISFEY